jgi:hypothetical protein
MSTVVSAKAALRATSPPRAPLPTKPVKPVADFLTRFDDDIFVAAQSRVKEVNKKLIR